MQENEEPTYNTNREKRRPLELEDAEHYEYTFSQLSQKKKN